MKYIESKMPHYGLRKLSIGVASVLLGMSAAVITGHADSAVNNSKNTSVAANVNGDNINNSYQEKSQSSAINSDSNTESTSEVATDARQRSASGSESNSVSNSVNVQGASSVINSYSDNKISVQDSNQDDNVAKNVKADWYWSGQKVNDQVTTEETIGWSTRRMGMDFEFDVDGNQLKNGNTIDIAKITQTSDNSGMTAFDYENTSVPVSINGQSIGTIDLTTQGTSAPPVAVGVRFNELDYRLHVTNPNLHFEGIQHFKVHLAWIGTFDFLGAWSFRGVRESNIQYHMTGDSLDKIYRVHYSWPNINITKRLTLGYSQEVDAGTFLTNAGWTNPGIWIYSPILQHADPSQLKIFQDSDGKQGSFSLNDDFETAARIRADKGNTILCDPDPWAGDEPSYPLMDDQGNVLSMNVVGDWDMAGLGVANMQVPQKRVADNLTLQQLKELNFQGEVISLQDDGSMLCYAKFPVKMLQFDFSKLRDVDYDRIAATEPFINYQAKNQEEALQMAHQLVDRWKKSPLQGTPMRWRLHLGGSIAVSDPSVEPHVFADLLDPGTGKVIQTSTEYGAFSFSTIDGQSTVKLHVINAQTGNVLTQVKSFTDWPNQGKHADLAVPTVANYRLITDVNAANAVLAKYHLSGHVLTENASVDYPAENTISDYYLVMTPTQESITVNIEDDDDQKILNTDTVMVKEDNSTAGLDNVNAQIKQLLDSGKYTLESSELNQIAFNGPKVLTIKLKHKLISTTRQYRIIEKLPDGTEKVIVSLKTILYKDANNGYYSDMGAYNDGTGDKLLKSNDTTDYAGVAPDGQNPSTWLKAKIDQFTGYVMHFDDAMDAYHYQDGVNVSLGDNNTYAYVDLFNGSQTRGTGDNISQNPMASRDFYITYTREVVPATLQIVDQDEGTILDSVKITGNYGDVISNDDFNAKLQTLLNTGHYEIVSNDLTKTLLYGDGNPTYTVTLKHHIDSTKRHYRIIEELPNGTNKVIVDLDATLYKDATSDTYITHGAFVDSDYHKKLLKTNDYIVHAGTFVPGYSDDYLQAPVDRVTGYSAQMTDGTNGFEDIIYAGFNSQNYQSLFDLFNGWIEEGKVGVSTKNPLASRDFHIIYTKNQYPVTIAYYDLSGQLVSTSTKQYYYQDVVDVQGQAPEKYVLVKGQNGKLTVGTDTNELDLLVVPAENRRMEKRQAVRLINVERIDGKVTTIEQMVTWQREIVENEVTGETTTGAWHSVGPDTMAAWSAPVVDGYQTPSIAALKTTPDTGVVTVLLKYQQSNDYDKPRYLDVNGQAYDDLPDGYQVLNGQSGDYGLLIVKRVNPFAPTPQLEYVTRLITVILPNGRVRTIKQRAVKGSHFMKAHLPHLKGFRCTIDGDVDRVIANDNMTAVVKFVKL